MTTKQLSLDTLSSLSKDCGLSLYGVLTDLSTRREAQQRLAAWQESGYAGELSYMNREAELFASPLRLLPEAKSLVLFGVHYSHSPCPKPPQGHGRIARYAWGKDYHRVIRKRMKGLLARVESEIGAPLVHRVFTDAVPLLERAFAREAGLGFIGKNTMLIRPREGSFFFVAEMLWDVELVDDTIAFPLVDESCGSCTRCLTHCPTDAFADAYTLDARKCISYLTIEKRGALSSWERTALGEWLFGCDVCQEVCPFNHSPMKTNSFMEVEQFSETHGSGPFVSLSTLLSLRSHQEFSKFFAGTPLMRAKREGLLRNACAVAVNKNEVELVSLLRQCVEEDASAVIRQHALWASAELAKSVGDYRIARQFVEKTQQRDESPEVLSEAEELLLNFSN